MQLKLLRGMVGDLHIASGTTSSNIEVGKNTTVGKTTIDGTANITGNGLIQQLTLNTSGSFVSIIPKYLTIKEGVTGKVGGIDRASKDSSQPSSTGNTGNTGNTGSVPTNQDNGFTHAQTVQAGSSVTLDSAPATGVTAWFAPANTIVFTQGPSMTKLIGDGVMNTIQAPLNVGNYKFYLINGSGASAASLATLTVTPAATSNAEIVLTSSQTVRGGATVTLDAPPASGYVAWLAPAATTVFQQGSSMTSLNGNGMLATMTAPTTNGQYKLFMVKAGVIESTSIAVLTVDETVPINQDSFLTADQFVIGGTITLSAVPKTGETIWLAPQGTTDFTESYTKSKLVGNGQLTSISVPSAEGSYKIFVQSSTSTSFSSASQRSVIVDRTTPNYQDQSFSPATDVIVKGETSISLNQPLVTGDTAWFAPEGTQNFVVGSMVTRLASGAGNSIHAPVLKGSYKLYVIDRAGNVSIPSIRKLIVDNTAPTISDVNVTFTADHASQSKSTVTLSANSPVGTVAWFAPAGTSNFVESATVKRM